jgi:ABC-type dipeptide/oligopeptide/nickel transport system permease subunit
VSTATTPTGAKSAATPERVTGVQLMQGIGVRPAVGFWTDAWQTVMKKPGAVLALGWLGLIAFFAVFSPVLASGHPIWMERTLLRDGQPSATVTSFPLWQSLDALDLLLLGWGPIALAYVGLGPKKGRGRRFWTSIGLLTVAVVVLAITGVVASSMRDAALDEARLAASIAATKGESVPPSDPHFVNTPSAGYVVGGGVGLAALAVLLVAPISTLRRRLVVGLLAVVPAAAAIGLRWDTGLERFNYTQREVSGEIRAGYTLIPWSPNQRYSELDRRPPMTRLGEATGLDPAAPPAGRVFILGTNAFGEDVLSNMLHACRLAITIGLVSTGVALIIGVTLGALMGYFGGWVDLLLYRVVEIFMAVPVLFLLIVAVAVLPEELRTPYVMMAIIGCFTWTGMARFTRAEFLKLRNQDFVQSAQAAGLPLRSILFKHMLPNGVAPVLVDTSFAIAAAISIEAVLSYLGLGPVETASWGRLLSSAISSEGQFKWWLAVFPGLAIFLTVLSYNLLGEALRDAIDPKLKKARV